MSMSVSDGRVSRSLQSLSFIHPSVVLTEYSQLTFFNERFFVKLSINNHIVGLVHKNRIIRTCLMYHAACKVEFQPFTRSYSQLMFFNLFFLKKVEKRQLRVQPFEWLKLNFASCVVHQTHSYNMVFVNETYDMIINTQFYTKYRPRVFYVLSL